MIHVSNKIYRKNFLKLLGEPKKIDEEYVLQEVKRLSLKKEHKSLYAKEDIEYILEDFE